MSLESKGKFKDRQPKLSASQRWYLLALHAGGEHTQAELAKLFSASRTPIYRELRRAGIESANRMRASRCDA
ncbi:hypothetical protein [Brachybacterium epidermidis]|uniref:hypothetical protein n=1 Tax=Brachybacterium epidermidis TaxID=2781983 RepID=UPI00398EB547